MPTIKLGTSTNSHHKVVRALEDCAGIPHGNGGDAAWIKQLVDVINEAKGTDIAYTREDYGYIFAYNTPKSALVLGQIKEKNSI